MNHTFAGCLGLSALLCLTFTGCGSLARHGPVDASLAAFVSPDTVALAGVQMDKLRTTPLYQKLAAEGRLPRFDEFRTESGFDPDRDLSRVLVASDGRNTLVMAHGNFTGRPSGNLETSQYRGYTLYSKDANEVIAFLDKNTALGGTPASVRAAIDQWKSGGHGAPRALLSRAEALPADTQIWAVVVDWKGASADQLRQLGNLSNVDRMLRSVEDATLTVDLRSGAHAALTGDCRAETDARNLADSLRGLAALARLAVPRNQPDLQRAFDGLQVNQEGRVVRVKVDIAQDLAEKLVR